MSYYVRAFCTSGTVPTIRTILGWLRQAGFDAEAVGESAKALDSPAWKSFELIYHPDKESLLVECRRNTSKRSMCQQTAKEELNALEDLDDSEAKKRVMDCVMNTRFIIDCTVTGDLKRKDALTVRSVLDVFVDHCGALIDMEDSGFWSHSDSPLLGRCVEEEG
jgi:hypothetical protein